MATTLNRTIQGGAKPKKRTIKRGGQLIEVGEEEIQTLADAKGIQQPLSPLGAAGLGADPDAAKMAGTQAQTRSALRTTIQEGANLADVERRERYTRQQSLEGKDTAAEEQVGQFASMAELGTRVDAKADEIMQQSIEEAEKRAGDVQVAALSRAVEENWDNLPATNNASLAKKRRRLSKQAKAAKNKGNWKEYNKLQAEVNRVSQQMQGSDRKTRAMELAQDAQRALAAGETIPPETLAKLGFLVGKEQGEIPTAEELAEVLIPDAEDIQLAKELTAADLDDPELLTSIADSLGPDYSLADLQGMSVRELQDAMSGVQAENFDRAKELERLASDPSLGPAERAEYRQMLDDFGVVGGTAAEQEFENLLKQTEDMHMVEFGGQEYAVEDLLNDEKLSSLAKDYFVNPELAEKLKEEEPEFAKFLDSHAEVMKQMTAGIEATFEEAGERKEVNNALPSLPDGTAFSDDEMSLILGQDYAKDSLTNYRSSKFLEMVKDPSAAGFPKEIGDPPRNTSTAMATAFRALAAENPKQAKAFMALPPEKMLEALKNGAADTYVASQQTSDLVDKHTDGQENLFYDTLFAGAGGYTGLQETLNSMKAIVQSGGTLTDEQQNIKDTIAGADWTADSVSQVKSREGFKDLLASPSLTELVDNPNAAGTANSLMTQVQAAAKEAINSNKYAKYYQNDGSFDANDAHAYMAEMQAEGGDDWWVQVADDLHKMGQAGSINGAAIETLQNTINQQVDEDVEEQANIATGDEPWPGGSRDWLDARIAGIDKGELVSDGHRVMMHQKMDQYTAALDNPDLPAPVRAKLTERRNFIQHHLVRANDAVSKARAPKNIYAETPQMTAAMMDLDEKQKTDLQTWKADFVRKTGSEPNEGQIADFKRYVGW